MTQVDVGRVLSQTGQPSRVGGQKFVQSLEAFCVKPRFLDVLECCLPVGPLLVVLSSLEGAVTAVSSVVNVPPSGVNGHGWRKLGIAESVNLTGRGFMLLHGTRQQRQCACKGILHTHAHARIEVPGSVVGMTRVCERGSAGLLETAWRDSWGLREGGLREAEEEQEARGTGHKIRTNEEGDEGKKDTSSEARCTNTIHIQFYVRRLKHEEKILAYWPLLPSAWLTHGPPLSSVWVLWHDQAEVGAMATRRRLRCSSVWRTRSLCIGDRSSAEARVNMASVTKVSQSVACSRQYEV
ncbi:hypothetical protein K438DRAFT_1787091 [Mycena galopus ATCC 62051]|nr:hypothetical protein K438DRAFT_1787091 [Mycena galopus ATCC 62051]